LRFEGAALLPREQPGGRGRGLLVHRRNRVRYGRHLHRVRRQRAALLRRRNLSDDLQRRHLQLSGG
jgi:hypothetical protein